LIIFFSLTISQVIANVSQCAYRPELKLLACRGTEQFVECPTEFESSPLGKFKFHVFGLRRDEFMSNRTVVEESVFELFPRRIDNTTYMNSTILVDEKPVDVFLYFAEKALHAGLRVTDAKCYHRLVQNVFASSLDTHFVKLESGEKVALFGEILLADKPVNKRWLGFGYPWLSGLGSWGWGAGWGLPYWGMLWG
jgi:hypothetical protein